VTPIARFFAMLARWFDRPDEATASGMQKRIKALEDWQQQISVQVAHVRVQVANLKLAAGYETFTSVKADEV
jgi:hypothetical protein